MTPAEKLISDWIKQEGFADWALSHSAVIKNLTKYIDKKLVELDVGPYGIHFSGKPNKTIGCGLCLNEKATSEEH